MPVAGPWSSFVCLLSDGVMCGGAHLCVPTALCALILWSLGVQALDSLFVAEIPSWGQKALL